MFTSILETGSGVTLGSVGILSVAVCSAASLILGIIAALVYMYKSSCTKNFAITIALLPLIVQALILLVSENMGAAGIAALGVFSLVRYRSVPGNSREILAIMLSMAIGVANGLGYVLFSVCLTAVICLMWILLFTVNFGEKRMEKSLKISIPENLEYNTLFDDIFETHTTSCKLTSVRTTNMGSLYELSYTVIVKDEKNEKAFLDEIRTRNGNLPVNLGRFSMNAGEL
ncbi:MAG: DUF4956 domain-containing protein [Eubacteriales bacterium]|nr:DUF4956 domain-containing protein [Eubacteriales bacterium]